jgi:phage-related protein
MTKIIITDKNAQKELDQFPSQVEAEFLYLMDDFETDGTLAFPEARKVTAGLFEMRVLYDGAYRGFYAYIGNTFIVILLFYHKKSQKALIRHIKTAENRLKRYKNIL